MPYGETSVVKTDLGITGTAFDARLTDWDAKASVEWDDMIYLAAHERRRITALPELPLQTAEVTQTDKDGTNNLIKARYFDNQKQPETALSFRNIAKGLAIKRVERLKTDSIIYGRVIR